jgi:hypothetical protein
MDGDVSHSSEIKLLTFRRDVRLLLCFPFSFVALPSYCHVHFYVVFCFFVLSRLFFSFTRGASSPEWVKPAAEGEGICFLFICFLFVTCSSVMFAFVFVYIAVMTDGR